jgi:CRISPR-associated protein Cmr4
VRVEMWGLLAETPLHYGAGQSLGVVDLPVAREATTGYPVVFGSGVKGSLREAAASQGLDTNLLFGSVQDAGALVVTDAQLLLLPIRGLERYYWWATSPALLERWERARSLAGLPPRGIAIPDVSVERMLTADLSGTAFLEEIQFQADKSDAVELIASMLGELIGDDHAAGRLRHQLAVVSDEDMRYLCRHALPVNPHNALDRDTKGSTNLWFEEVLPMDTLLYTVLMVQERGASALGEFAASVDARPFLRLGANETVGQGWCRVSRVEAKKHER